MHFTYIYINKEGELLMEKVQLKCLNKQIC